MFRNFFWNDNISLQLSRQKYIMLMIQVKCNFKLKAYANTSDNVIYFAKRNTEKIKNYFIVL